LVGGGLLRWDFNPRYDRFGSKPEVVTSLRCVRFTDVAAIIDEVC
jgi:hypothetical protein